MSRTRPGLASSLVALLAVAAAACTEPALPPGAQTPGDPLVGLSDAERARFLLGRALFERLATQEEGLGPLFNGERCSTCHDEPATGGGGTKVLVLKATAFAEGRCSPLEERGGDNIQLRATPLLEAAGLGPEEVPAEATATAFVTAPPLYGLGLLEAVAEEEILRHADPDDADGDGIRGRPARFPDGRLARFGRKGDAASVHDFVDSALRFELGFTTVAHPREETRNGVPIPGELDPMPDPEMDAPTQALITDYVRFLAPLAPAAPSPEAADSVREGEELFQEVGCTRCHVPELVTGDAPETVLSGRTLRAYTDLLLHDLGAGDGDVCTPQAGPGLYRTAPLWGLRYRSRYLHDGSAVTLEDAILAHGGESEGVRAAYEGLPEGRRALVLRFLSGL